MRFGKIERRKVADQIAASIRDAIVGGSLGIGESLPAERALADRFGVNRSSIREALHRLEAWGMVETRHGEGTKVTDYLATAGLHVLPYLMAPGGELDPTLFRDLMEIRVMLLQWTAERATQRCSADDLQNLEDILLQMRSASNIAELQRLDYLFFETQVAMAQNRVLALLSNAIRRVYLTNNRLFTKLYEPSVFSLAHHESMLKAMEEGDSQGAGFAMKSFGEAAFRTVSTDLKDSGTQGQS